MGSTRDIKKRIANVTSVEQIIRAMNMVASTGLVKARAQLEGIRPIYNELERVVQELGKKEKALEHVFYKKGQGKNPLYIILTSDRGLSGGYNTNICKEALKHMEQAENEKILVVGSKGYEYLKRQGKEITRSIVDVSDAKVYYGSENLAQWCCDLYLSGEVDEIFVAYTRFDNVLTHIPVIDQILPIRADVDYDYKGMDIKYEPTLEVFIDEMIPLYLHMNIFRAFSEAHTSEQAARMISMDSAEKNANELVEDLSRVHNRQRQAAITQELNEIVGSASVLNKGGLDDR